MRPARPPAGAGAVWRRRRETPVGLRSGFEVADRAGLLAPGQVRWVVGDTRLAASLLRSVVHLHAVVCRQPCTLAATGSSPVELHEQLVVVHTPRPPGGPFDAARTAAARLEVDAAPITYRHLTGDDLVGAASDDVSAPVVFIDATRDVARVGRGELAALARTAARTGTAVWIALADPGVRRRRRMVDSVWRIELDAGQRPGGIARITVSGPRRMLATQQVGDISYRARIAPLATGATTSVMADGTIITVTPVGAPQVDSTMPGRAASR